MAAQLPSFEPLSGVDGVHVASNSSLRCSAIVLKNGSLGLFSPVPGLGEAARASLAEIGPVAFLLAPNHYHNKAIAEYAAAFPDAVLCAPADAIPRLKKITGMKIGTIDRLAAALDGGMDFLEPEGLKTGEVWLRRCASGRTAWFVVDAFCGPKTKKAIEPAPELLKTFPKYGVGDAVAYKAWVEKQIGKDKPGIVVPCHGAILRAPDLAEKLKSIVATL